MRILQRNSSYKFLLSWVFLTTTNNCTLHSRCLCHSRPHNLCRYQLMNLNILHNQSHCNFHGSIHLHPSGYLLDNHTSHSPMWHQNPNIAHKNNKIQPNRKHIQGHSSSDKYLRNLVFHKSTTNKHRSKSVDSASSEPRGIAAVK